MNNNQKKSPLKAKPLRLPGQSLDNEIHDELYDHAITPMLLALFTTLMALLEWFRWYFGTPYTPMVYSFTAVICIGFAVVKTKKSFDRVKILKQGRDGERAVGQFLETQRKHGYKIFHDFQGDGFNIDHAVFTEHGLYSIETKTYSKPHKGKSEIIVLDDHLLIDGYKDKKIITQARAEAKWLSDLVFEQTGKRFPVKPVVVFPGWFVKNSAGISDFLVLNPKALPGFINNSKKVISREDVSMISNKVSVWLRNN